MFGWFRPTCPVDPQSKQWIEKRMRWLTCEFGAERLLDINVTLPTPDYFPDSYDGSKGDARRLWRRVCRYTELDPDLVPLRFYPENKPLFAEGRFQCPAGIYDQGTV